MTECAVWYEHLRRDQIKLLFGQSRDEGMRGLIWTFASRPNRTFIWSGSWWANVRFDVNAYFATKWNFYLVRVVMSECAVWCEHLCRDQIKLLLGQGRDEQNQSGPEYDWSEEPTFSGSSRLQINNDFLLRDEYFKAFSAAGKPGPMWPNFGKVQNPTDLRSRNSLLRAGYKSMMIFCFGMIISGHFWPPTSPKPFWPIFGRSRKHPDGAQTIVIPC